MPVANFRQYVADGAVAVEHNPPQDNFRVCTLGSTAGRGGESQVRLTYDEVPALVHLDQCKAT